MEPISRRSALTMGGAGTAFVLAGGSALLWDWSTAAGSQSPSPQEATCPTEHAPKRQRRSRPDAHREPIPGGIRRDNCQCPDLQRIAPGTDTPGASRRRDDGVTRESDERAGVLVTMAAGTSVLQTHPVDRGSPAGMMGECGWAASPPRRRPGRTS